MNKETLRMQMLAGLITESEYKGRLNELPSPSKIGGGSNSPGNVITIKNIKDIDHTRIVKWMQNEFDGKYFPGMKWVSGHLTDGGDFALDVSKWDKRDLEKLKKYLESQSIKFNGGVGIDMAVDQVKESNENNEFSKLLEDLDIDLKEYDGDEIVYEEDESSMEVGISIFPDYRNRNKEILKAIKDIVKKNPLFMINKESIERYRDEEGVTLTFDIIKK